MRLSDKDQNDSKTMNTHLHILEGYTNLYRVWKDAGLRERLASLISIFFDRIICPDGEWYWSLRSDGTPNTTDDRAGFWKCPYHNGHMCLEVLEREI